jgi:hypothetical protein
MRATFKLLPIDEVLGVLALLVSLAVIGTVALWTVYAVILSYLL